MTADELRRLEEIAEKVRYSRGPRADEALVACFDLMEERAFLYHLVEKLRRDR